MINTKTFLALDLEMNTPEGSFTSGKIIQVGIAIGNLHMYKYNLEDKADYIEKSWYVNPYEKIYPRITELTGITDDDVNDHSTPLDEIQNQISYLMNHYQCFPNPVVWGGGDADLLKSELKSTVGECRIFGHREIDVKTIYTFFKLSKNEKTNSSLKSALNSTKNNFMGTPHRALDDARNTLNLFFALMSKQMMINNFINEAQKLK